MKSIIGAYVSLMVLMGFAVMVPYLHLGSLSVWASLGIGIAKAAIVVAIFMEAKEGSRLYLTAFLAGTLWLGILLFIEGLDVFTRGNLGHI